MKTKSMALCAALSLSSGLALAEAPMEGLTESQADEMHHQQARAEIKQETFQSLDADGDGMLSEAEAENSTFGTQFSSMDVNSDGQLEWSEVSIDHGSATAAGMSEGAAEEVYQPAMPGEEATMDAPQEGLEAAGGDAKEYIE